MGLSALTLRGWKKDPRGEGRAHLVIAVVVIVLYTLYNLIWGSFDLFYTISSIVLAIWGVVGFIGGEILHKINQKIK